jgi:hypothetical protein
MDDKKLEWRDLLKKFMSERTEVLPPKPDFDVEVFVLDIKSHEEDMVSPEKIRAFVEEVNMIHAGLLYRNNHALVMPGNNTVH